MHVNEEVTVIREIGNEKWIMLGTKSGKILYLEIE